MNKIQILYPHDDMGKIDDYFLEESIEMAQRGFIVDTSIKDEAKSVVLRSFIIREEANYPTDRRLIQGWNEYRKTMNMHEYLDCISDFSVPSFLSAELNSELEEKIKQKGWSSAFIKSSSKSLWPYGLNKSKWPDTSLEEMNKIYSKYGFNGPFIIRKFIDNPEIFYDEQRYWILNGNAYHPSGIIPNFVEIAGDRVFKFSGSKYFTLDIAGDFIVEINPGEGSDRGGDTPLDFFCDIFAKEFLYK